ncbi:MAG: GGDEF domain-containing protein [Myxococcales bacterium]|nr:GGDEF domain-containing protein [Myxococcales bacterium]
MAEDEENSFEQTIVVDRTSLDMDVLGRPEGAEIAVLTVLTGNRRGVSFELRSERIVVGRGDRCQIRLDDDGISRNHAQIKRATAADDYELEDLGSTNGTYLNGLKVKTGTLTHGDRVAFGTDTVAKFEYQDLQEAKLRAEIYQRATRDPLTGLLNRRVFFERLREEFSFARRHGTPLSLLMFDVDHFKSVNDTHGHAVGDEVLRGMGRLLLDLCRDEDVVCRYGGEEFALVARGLDVGQGVAFGERIRQCVELMKTPLDGGRELQITVSIGVASTGGLAHNKPEELLADADHLLYRAKEQGRNRVESENTLT